MGLAWFHDYTGPGASLLLLQRSEIGQAWSCDHTRPEATNLGLAQLCDHTRPGALVSLLYSCKDGNEDLSSCKHTTEGDVT